MKNMTMMVWNVELGLAIHVKSPNGKYIVIDLGSTKDFSPLDFLPSKDISYLIITHPHLDHFSDIEGLSGINVKVLNACRDYCDYELLNGVNCADVNKVKEYCRMVNSYTAPVFPMDDPRNKNTFEGVDVQVFRASGCDKINKNNYSAIVVMRLGMMKIVICGDNERESFEKLMRQSGFCQSIKNCDILVASHHGRESGYCEEFVNLAKPRLTIISDTVSGTTSVSDKYSVVSSGCSVFDKKKKTHDYRYCLTTRNDGNIFIEISEKDFSVVKNA